MRADVSRRRSTRAVAARVRDALAFALAELRFEPSDKRIRVERGHELIADTTRAILVWEPRRVVPSYAVPERDLRVALTPAESTPAPGGILHPGIPFAAHSAEGEAVSVGAAEAAGFRLRDPDVEGYVALDFEAFDAWYEEDEPIVGHPRDPFHRVDTRRSSRHVRIERNGELLAETSRAVLLFETNLPVRFYLPREDVVASVEPSARKTYCPYKGEASYYTVGGVRDIAWSYEPDDLLPDGPAAIGGLVAFFDERIDMVLDGERRPRPDTAIADAILDEVGISR
jgi:uncharacterized protein (DUF427 family)